MDICAQGEEMEWVDYLLMHEWMMGGCVERARGKGQELGELVELTPWLNPEYELKR